MVNMLLEEDKIRSNKYDDLDNRMEMFYTIEHIPEFVNKENDILLIRFESISMANEYLEIMKGYHDLFILDTPEDDYEAVYDIEFTKPGWYKGYTEEEKENYIKYKYVYDTKFNEILKEM